MSSTTKCPNCGVVLNLPEGAAGRRLRCPKCATKFSSDQPDARSSSSALGVAEARTASSILAPSPTGDQVNPRAEGDLRDTFDLPMMMEADKAPSRSPRSKETADAVALFQDDQVAPSRRRSGAEARAKSRHCPSCGGLVASGMSLCTFCGFDLETGTRVGLDDDIATIPAAARGASLPIGIGVVGGVGFLGSLVLLVVSVIQWVRHKGDDDITGFGFLALAMVCMFGIFAAVQLLRGKTPKLLMAALTLGALIDVIVLIALPVYRANEESGIRPSVVVNNEDDEMEGPAIEPYVKRLDFNSITWGIAILLMYAVVVVYLMSAPVRRYFDRVQSDHLAPIRT
jgi:hypothetical protein